MFVFVSLWLQLPSLWPTALVELYSCYYLTHTISYTIPHVIFQKYPQVWQTLVDLLKAGNQSISMRMHKQPSPPFNSSCFRSAITSPEPRLPCPALWSSQCHCYCTVGVPRVWWRSPSEQLYHQWHQHYDNHLTNQWNHSYSTIQCESNYRGCCHQLHWNQWNSHVDLLWKWV